jgi:hypothetical protein
MLQVKSRSKRSEWLPATCVVIFLLPAWETGRGFHGNSIAMDNASLAVNACLFGIPSAGYSRSQGTDAAEPLAGAMERVQSCGGDRLALPSYLYKNDDWLEPAATRVLQ